MVHILGILACFENNEGIIQLFLSNENIIVNLFQYYYEFNKLETLLFIDNIMIKQEKNVRNFILEKGGFDIIIKNICEYDNDKEVLNSSIKILFKLLEYEKDDKYKIYLEKIYKTSVPDKIKELYNNNNKISKNEMIITIINYFDNY